MQASSFQRSKTLNLRPGDVRFAAGAALTIRSFDREVGVFEWIAANAHLVAAAIIRTGRGFPSKLRALSAEMLANAINRGGHVILMLEPCMVSCTGAFCMDQDSLTTVHDACAVLCIAARREVWGSCLGLGLVVECLGIRLFRLCCSLDGPEVKRTYSEELLVAKMFELVWRLRQHRHCSAFDKLCELDGHKCILTAAISYLYDARAPDHRDLRHYRDGPICDIRPSALDCCLRMMEGMVLFDIRRNDAKGRTRVSRVADASRGLCASQALSGSEQISCEVLLVTTKGAMGH